MVGITHGVLDLQTEARARQLLIIVTHGKNWNPGSDFYEKNVTLLNMGIEKGYIRKIGDTQRLTSLFESK